MPVESKPQHRRLKGLVAAGSWAYLVVAISLWVFLRVAGDRWWFAAFILFGPRWVVALPALLLAPDALAVTPLVIVAVVVAYVASERLTPTTTEAREGPPEAGETAARPSGARAS